MRRLGAADGMPSRMVLALAQDRQGYIWAATDDGLARVDGVGLRVWRHDPADPGSIPGNEVETLLVDPMDRVWVGGERRRPEHVGPGRSGVRSISPTSMPACDGQFWSLAYAAQVAVDRHQPARHLPAQRGRHAGAVPAPTPDDPRSLPDNTIYTLLADPQGHVWVGTRLAWPAGTDDRFNRIAPALLGGKSVFRLTREPDGTVWAGTEGGLFRIDADDGAPGTVDAQRRCACRHGHP